MPDLEIRVKQEAETEVEPSSSPSTISSPQDYRASYLDSQRPISPSQPSILATPGFTVSAQEFITKGEVMVVTPGGLPLATAIRTLFGLGQNGPISPETVNQFFSANPDLLRYFPSGVITPQKLEEVRLPPRTTLSFLNARGEFISPLGLELSKSFLKDPSTTKTQQAAIEDRLAKEAKRLELLKTVEKESMKLSLLMKPFEKYLDIDSSRVIQDGSVDTKQRLTLKQVVALTYQVGPKNIAPWMRNEFLSQNPSLKQFVEKNGKTPLIPVGTNIIPSSAALLAIRSQTLQVGKALLDTTQNPSKEKLIAEASQFSRSLKLSASIKQAVERFQQSDQRVKAIPIEKALSTLQAEEQRVHKAYAQIKLPPAELKAFQEKTSLLTLQSTLKAADRAIREGNFQARDSLWQSALERSEKLLKTTLPPEVEKQILLNRIAIRESSVLFRAAKDGGGPAVEQALTRELGEIYGEIGRLMKFAKSPEEKTMVEGLQRDRLLVRTQALAIYAERGSDLPRKEHAIVDGLAARFGMILGGKNPQLGVLIFGATGDTHAQVPGSSVTLRANRPAEIAAAVQWIKSDPTTTPERMMKVVSLLQDAYGAALRSGQADRGNKYRQLIEGLMNDQNSPPQSAFQQEMLNAELVRLGGDSQAALQGLDRARNVLKTSPEAPPAAQYLPVIAEARIRTVLVDQDRSQVAQVQNLSQGLRRELSAKTVLSAADQKALMNLSMQEIEALLRGGHADIAKQKLDEFHTVLSTDQRFKENKNEFLSVYQKTLSEYGGSKVGVFVKEFLHAANRSTIGEVAAWSFGGAAAGAAIGFLVGSVPGAVAGGLIGLGIGTGVRVGWNVSQEWSAIDKASTAGLSPRTTVETLFNSVNFSLDVIATVAPFAVAAKISANARPAERILLDEMSDELLRRAEAAGLTPGSRMSKEEITNLVGVFVKETMQFGGKPLAVISTTNLVAGVTYGFASIERSSMSEAEKQTARRELLSHLAKGALLAAAFHGVNLAGRLSVAKMQEEMHANFSPGALEEKFATGERISAAELLSSKGEGVMFNGEVVMIEGGRLQDLFVSQRIREHTAATSQVPSETQVRQFSTDAKNRLAFYDKETGQILITAREPSKLSPEERADFEGQLAHEMEHRRLDRMGYDTEKPGFEILAYRAQERHLNSLGYELRFNDPSGRTAFLVPPGSQPRKISDQSLLTHVFQSTNGTPLQSRLAALTTGSDFFENPLTGSISQQLQLHNGRVIIGRDVREVSNGIEVINSKVSRTHLTITEQEKGFLLADTSSNGTSYRDPKTGNWISFTGQSKFVPPGTEVRIAPDVSFFLGKPIEYSSLLPEAKSSINQKLQSALELSVQSQPTSTLLIGRNHQTELLDPLNPTVSGTHAQLKPLPGGNYLLIDGVEGKPSTNGIFVFSPENKQFERVQGQVLVNPGDVIRFGTSKDIMAVVPQQRPFAADLSTKLSTLSESGFLSLGRRVGDLSPSFSHVEERHAFVMKTSPDSYLVYDGFTMTKQDSSKNGVFILLPGGTEYQRIPPNTPFRAEAGSKIRLGFRSDAPEIILPGERPVKDLTQRFMERPSITGNWIGPKMQEVAEYMKAANQTEVSLALNDGKKKQFSIRGGTDLERDAARIQLESLAKSNHDLLLQIQEILIVPEGFLGTSIDAKGNTVFNRALCSDRGQIAITGEFLLEKKLFGSRNSLQTIGDQMIVQREKVDNHVGQQYWTLHALKVFQKEGFIDPDLGLEDVLGRPFVRRDVEQVDGCIAWGGRDLYVVIDSSRDKVLQQQYPSFIESQFGSKEKLKKMPEEKVLELVEKYVRTVLKYDSAGIKDPAKSVEAEIRLSQNRPARGDPYKVHLGEWIKRNKGVCYEMALFAGYLIEQLKAEGLLSGSFSVQANRDPDRGGHAWARYTKQDGKVFFLDPAQSFFGSFDQIKDKNWVYLTDEDRKQFSTMHFH